jgi:signal transduction histidine kinase
MLHGLSIVGARSESLSRFIGAYAHLAKLPQPRLDAVDVGAWVRRVTMLEPRLRPLIEPGPPTTIQADVDQLEQALINLVRNAVDASLQTDGKVLVGWQRVANSVQVYVRDEGHGLSNTANLFVPFFTTKPGGSGIGLVLSRQITEAHGGSLALRNREDRQGCEATMTLPV